MACLTIHTKSGPQTIDIGVVNVNISNIGTNEVTSSTKEIGTANNTGFANFTVCTTTGTAQWFVADKSPIETRSSWSVYDTSIPGISVAVQVRDSHVATWFPSSEPSKPVYLRHHGNNGGWYYFRVKAYLIIKDDAKLMPGTYVINQKIGKSALSNLSSTTVFQPIGGALGEVDVSLSATVNVIGASCDVNAGDTNQTVTMPTSSVNNFSGVGSSTGTSSFQIRVTCGLGANVHMFMEDANAVANTGQFLQLSGDSTASGVGVEIYANGSDTPVSYGRDNLWLLSSTATTHNIPFVAKYVQTDATIQAGTVNAQTVFNLFYK